MKNIFTSFLSISLLLAFFSCNSNTSNKILMDVGADYAITNVTVLPMNSEAVLKNQTVLIKDGKILSIGTTKGVKSQTTIDGTGKFLLPGLTEMHAHIPVAKDGDNNLVKETLFLYLSQGITTIRGMLGDPYHLELKKQVGNGEILSPRIYTSSPSLNGNSIKTPAEATAKITQYQKDGYDFLKIHPGIKLEVWNAVEKTASTVGIPYAGHVPIEVGIQRAIAAKYKTVDHLDGYIEGLVPKSANVEPDQNGFFGYNFTDLAEEALIEDLVQKTKQNGVGIVATQTLFTRWFSPESAAKLAAEPEMKYMPPKTLFAWRQSKNRLVENENYTAQQWQRYINLRKKILKRMDEQGVTFLLGSDAPQVFNVPGFSIHHELKAMKEVGISNYKLLQAGTANPAIFFGAKGQYGIIEKGAAADLVLLDANPLLDIGNSSKISGVMVRGTWLSKMAIEKGLKGIEERYASRSN